MRNNQSGFGHLILLLLLVAVVGIGFAGYRVWSSRVVSTVKPVSTNVANSSNDLSSTSKELDQSSAQLDSSLNAKDLDTDLTALL